MSTIAPCVYDARGRIVEPDPFEVREAKIGLAFDTGRTPTFDKGYTHVFSLSTTGLTRDQAQHRMKRLMARFYDEAEMVPGFRKLTVNQIQGLIPCNKNFQIICEIVYAVEDAARSRRNRPGSPDAGSTRGAGRRSHAMS